MNRETIGVRHVSSDEINAGLLKAKQEMRVTAEAVDLGDDQLGTVQPARFERLRQHRAIIVLAAFDFDKLFDQLPAAAVQVAIYSRALRFHSQTTASLASGADPQVRNPLAFRHDSLRLRHSLHSLTVQ